MKRDIWSKCFLFKVDSFSEEPKRAGKQTGSHKFCLLCNQWRTFYHRHLPPIPPPPPHPQYMLFCTYGPFPKRVFVITYWIKLKVASRQFKIFFFLFSQKIGFDIACKFCMQCQSQFQGKLRKKSNINLSFTELAQRVVKCKLVLLSRNFTLNSDVS